MGTGSVRSRRQSQRYAKVQMYLFAQSAFQPDAGCVADDQHPDHHPGIDRKPPSRTVERSQMPTHGAKVEEPRLSIDDTEGHDPKLRTRTTVPPAPPALDPLSPALASLRRSELAAKTPLTQCLSKQAAPCPAEAVGRRHDARGGRPEDERLRRSLVEKYALPAMLRR